MVGRLGFHYGLDDYKNPIKKLCKNVYDYFFDGTATTTKYCDFHDEKASDIINHISGKTPLKKCIFRHDVEKKEPRDPP